MYTYNGFNAENNHKLEKTFDTENEAFDFARAKSDMYPEFEVLDDAGNVLDARHIMPDNTSAALNDMTSTE